VQWPINSAGKHIYSHLLSASAHQQAGGDEQDDFNYFSLHSHSRNLYVSLITDEQLISKNNKQWHSNPHLQIRGIGKFQEKMFLSFDF